MEFDYIPWETDIATKWLPMLPIQLNGFPIGNGLVDTGATVTILPMPLLDLLGIDLDEKKALIMNHAGGGTFKAIPGAQKVTYCIDHSGFRAIQWKGTVFFSAMQDTVLLGHYQCLDQLLLTLDGPMRKLRIDQKAK